MRVLERRVAAAQATLDRFLGKPFVWGVTDCARLCAFDLRRLGVRAPLAPFGSYRSALGAAKALKRQGFDDLGGVLDGLGLRRIAPASALPADILAMPGEAGHVAIGVALGNGRVLGFHAESPVAVVFGVDRPELLRGAWSAL